MTQTIGTQPSPALHVAIVGAGIGGLAASIACRRASPPFKVTVLERTPKIETIGAGIHIPCNASRVLRSFGLLDKLKAAGGYELEHFSLRRWEDGRCLAEKPLKARADGVFGAPWIAIHRGDYQQVLLAEALAVGVDVVTSAEVTSIESSLDSQQTIILKDGKQVRADVVIGADGLWSLVRETVLGRPFPPQETGDLAYRGVFTRDELASLKSEKMDRLLAQTDLQVWLGPYQNVVFYPLRDHTEYNLVVIVTDDMPQGVRTSLGTVEEMAAQFEGWDPVLSEMLSRLKTPLKWKLLHFKSLDQWTKGTIALLGDASHPTLPYQAQGAAMAVEDGGILGLLLSKLQDAGGLSSSMSQSEKNLRLTRLFRLYEQIRKRRTETNVAGAVDTRHYYHLPDGEEQVRRDRDLAGLGGTKWQGACSFNWGDGEYLRSLLGFDVLGDAERKFEEWWEREEQKGGNESNEHVNGNGYVNGSGYANGTGKGTVC